MIGPKLLLIGVAAATLVLIGCSDSTDPSAAGDVSLSRSGTFHVEKDCTDYHGYANDSCLIIVSTLKDIPAGSRVVYARDMAADGLIDSDVVIDLPGPEKNAVYGHCAVNVNQVDGTTGCVFSGGTGRFKQFQATVALTYLHDAVFAWNGSYSFKD
jgi:hypothetical protein